MLLSASQSSLILPSGHVLDVRETLKPLRLEDVVFMLHRHVLFPGSPDIGSRPSLARHVLLLATIARGDYPDDRKARSLACFGMMVRGLAGGYVTSDVPSIPLATPDLETRLMERFDIPEDHRPANLRDAYKDLMTIGEVAHLGAYYKNASRAFSAHYGPEMMKRARGATKNAVHLGEIPDATIPSLLTQSLTEHILSIGGLP
jgi:hypothetical protein